MASNASDIHKMNLNCLVLILTIWLMEVAPFLASNKKIVTGHVTYVCAFFREKDLSIDDLSMPEILTFCSCGVIHESWALTSRQCYVQLDWFVSPITNQFTGKLPERLHNIVRIVDKRELSLVKVRSKFQTEFIEIAPRSLSQTTICELYGFSTPNNLPVQGDVDGLIYKVWSMKGDVLQTNIHVLDFLECKQKYGFLSPYKRNITYSTLCVESVDNEYLEPCSFDRGAPIVCNGKLHGVLVYNRPAPSSLPLHLPSGCYGNISNNNISFYAEGLTVHYAKWIIENITNK